MQEVHLPPIYYRSHLDDEKSIKQDYLDITADSLCPPSVTSKRIADLYLKREKQRLGDFNSKRKIKCLANHVDDHDRLLLLLQDKDVPGIRRLLTVHLRNNGSIKSFIEKCEKAVGWKMVGHGTYQRTRIQ